MATSDVGAKRRVIRRQSRLMRTVLRARHDLFGGAGVAVDLIEAHKWFNIAAMRGHGMRRGCAARSPSR